MVRHYTPPTGFLPVHCGENDSLQVQLFQTGIFFYLSLQSYVMMIHSLVERMNDSTHC